MDEIIAYHLEDEKGDSPQEPAQPLAARINLFDRLKEQVAPAKKTVPKPTPVPVTPTPTPTAPPNPPLPPTPPPTHPQTAPDLPHPPSQEQMSWLTKLFIATLVAVALATAAFIGYKVYHNADTQPTPSPSPTPEKNSRLLPGTFSTSTPSAATPSPTAKPQTPSTPGTTYTVQQGDTLITIGEKLNKDWRTIAAANGNIPDPNLIHPGQILKIP